MTRSTKTTAAMAGKKARMRERWRKSLRSEGQKRWVGCTETS